jgi:hypothetical protein
MKEELKQKILNEIREDKLKMKPKYLFWLQTFAVAFFTLFFCILAFYIFSFIGYLFIDWGILNAPRFGMMGLIDTIRSLPIFLILLGLFAIYATFKFAKYFEFVYKKKVINMFLGIFTFIIFSQIVFIVSGAQDYVKREAFRRQIPLVPQMFKDMRERKDPYTIVGKVVATSTNSITIRNRRGNILEIPLATITEISVIKTLENEDFVQILLTQPLSPNKDQQINTFVQDVIIIEREIKN